jgi:hypothetical protein
MDSRNAATVTTKTSSVLWDWRFNKGNFYSVKKLKLSHYTPRRRLGEKRYSSYSFSTSVLDGGEWSASRPCRSLAPENGLPVPIAQEAGWAPEPVWPQRLEEKSFRLCRGSNLYRPVVQTVARHYTDWAIRPTFYGVHLFKYFLASFGQQLYVLSVHIKVS